MLRFCRWINAAILRFENGKNKIMILFLTRKRLFGDVGGIESMGKRLLTGMKKLSIPVILFSRDFLPKIMLARRKKNSQNAPEKMLPRDITFSLYAIKEIMLSLLFIFPLLYAVKMSRKHGFTPVILVFDSFSGLPALISCKVTGSPLVVQAHGLYPRFIGSLTRNRIITKVLLEMENAVIRRANLVLSVNKETITYYERFYTPSRMKYRLISTPLDTKVFAPNLKLRNCVRKELGIGTESYVIGFVGRLAYEKNVELLIHAFKKALESSSIPSGSLLVIVGDGPLKRQLIELASDLSIEDKIIFTGLRRDVHRLMNAMDVLVLPSRAEGLPCVVLEAASCAVPIILSDLLCHKEFLEKAKCGLTFKAGSMEDLVRCLSIISNNNNLRRELGTNGRKYVEVNHEITHVIKDYYRAITKSVG